MSEFLRRHLLRMKKMRELIMDKGIILDYSVIMDYFNELIADVEAHQHVIKLKHPAPIDYQRVRELATENSIPLTPKQNAIDWGLVLDTFRIHNIEIPTIPSIYEQKHHVTYVTKTYNEEEAEE